MDEWRELAACRGTPITMWFTGATVDPDAVELCSWCPVKAECLDDALAAECGLSAQWRHGVRGGLTPRERAEMDGTRVRRNQAQRADALR